MLDSSCVRFVLKGWSEQRQVCGGDRQIGREDSMRLCYRQWRSGDVSLGYRMRMMCEADMFGSTPESKSKDGACVVCMYV